MYFTARIDRDSRDQAEIQMNWPLYSLAKGVLRYDPSLDSVITVRGGKTTIRIPEFEIAAAGRNLDEAERMLDEITSDLLYLSQYDPPKLDVRMSSIVAKIRARATSNL